MNTTARKRILAVCLAESLGLLDEPMPSRRKYWVHPSNKKQQSSNRFPAFFEEIRKHEDTFFNYYRMSVKSFDELIQILRPHITKQNTYWRNPLSPEERLSITLRYLATGSTYAALQLEYFVGKSTISSVVKETCQVIWDALKDEEMPDPSEEQWAEIADVFYKKTNFPNCVGAVDGKHIRCIQPKGSDLKLSRKKCFSVVLMAVADANLRFIAIDVGAYGQEGDSIVFRDSELGKKLFSGQMNLPPPKCLPNTSSLPQPFVMVGDEAFRLHTNLLRPYPTRNLDSRKRVFNYRLARCRRSVECAFGVLTNKWRVLQTSVLLQPGNIDRVVKACCILHNFVCKRDGVNFEDAESHTLADVSNFGHCAQQEGLKVRDVFADYFMGTGAVTFQNRFMF